MPGETHHMRASDIARVEVGPSTAWRAGGRNVVLGVTAAAVAFIILVGMAASDRLLGVFWLFGLAFGFVLQRSRFCFASAFRDLFLLGDARVMKGVIAGLAVATAGFTVLMARLLPEVGFGSLPPGATVLPLGIHTVLGGVLFGIGMVLAGGCTSGSLYRAGEGYVGSMVALLGIMLGLEVSSHTWNWWWNAHISRAPLIWFPDRLGYLGAMLLTFGGLLLAFLLVSWWEFRTSIMLSPKPDEAHMASSFGEHTDIPGASLQGLGSGRINLPARSTLVLENYSGVPLWLDVPLSLTPPVSSGICHCSISESSPAPSSRHRWPQNLSYAFRNGCSGTYSRSAAVY